MGTKLMSDADGLKLRKPNQYVETIVYNEEPDSDGSDGSEIYNTDDVHNMVLVNQERFDLLNDPTSLENTLCHKFGDLKMRTSNVSMHYDKHLLFKDPYIREQLQNLNILQVTSNEFDDHLLPASLLDYICCKRLDDNYNFYMDNIIKYVRHTIDQLKRISNGDYLTEKAKEKWRESVYATNSSDAKILATSSSIPLQIERKANINSSSLNEAIHSEVDIRTLSKILEKKIIVEIPKIIPGSYKLFSKLCSDKLVLGCKREHQSKNIDIKKMSQFDVVLQLGQSAEAPKEEKEKQAPKLVEIKETNEEFVLTSMSLEQNISEIIDESEEKTPKLLNDVIAETADTSLSTEREEDYCDDDEYNFNNIVSESSDSSALKDFLDTEVVTNIQPKETQFKITTSEALALSIQSLNMDSLPEENCEDFKNPVKRKSSPRVRVKSPYENKSYLIEEKKRKKLLEIRERREKKKIAMGESCKIKKNRYGKGSVMPRPSSSVTKLSITNKSFYNSIYGQTAKHVDMKIRKYKSNEGKKDFIADEHIGEEQVPEMLTPDVNNKKYIDRSYYLDEAVTEMMYTEPSDHSSDVRELFSVSTSAGSNLEPNMSMPPTSITSPCDKLERFDEHNELNALNENGNQSSVASFQNTLNVRPSILLSNNELVKNGRKKSIPIECRRSIDKIYDLMKKLSNSGAYECKSPESKCTTIDSNKIDENVYQEKSMKYSDSGTSLKHLLVSSNPSSFSFGKICTTDRTTVSKNGVSKKTNGLMTVVPKVIISTKQHDPNLEIDKVKKERKKVSMNTQKVPENPLKAISQLLHEFDSVQKTRQKLTTGTKSNKKLEISFENRNTSRSGFMKTRSRLETTDVIKNDHVNEKKVIPKERKPRPIVGYDTLKLSEQPLSCEDRHIERTTKKRLADIIDEVKEAKGEAVRGPSKFTSRLNTLAQPKKSYVQAHSEEYQTKYGRTIVADRLQRLAGAQVAMQNPERQMGSAGTRGRSKRSAEAASATITRQQPPSLPPLAERAAKHRRPKSASPEKSMMPEATSYNHSHVLDAPEILKNKMVAVESYVKSHYGHALLPGGEQARSAIKARVPLVPDDLQLLIAILKTCYISDWYQFSNFVCAY
ncbi:unnamed protein product [Diatraea saccharalis]|uniref:Uncharacterized protein n=1 Tax=Diatraea saccharalis TaxID=40085 RepID=A0A9N9R7L7_9NEOP|nr:unnamed protein product [Diatraea saccharalis]